MINRFTTFLGTTRTTALFLLIAITGLASLVLNAVSDVWVPLVQTLLAAAAVFGAVFIIVGKLPREDRSRWFAILIPAILAVLIGLLIVPQYLLVSLGLGVGWIVAGLFLFRARAPMQYQKAVKLLRKSQYAEAVKEMDDLIKIERDKPQHYDFRARIFRVWGKLDRAKKDYKKVIELAPDLVAGYNALSEVYVQTGEYPLALEAAQKAYELAPDQWVALYNLGMIEDRLRRSKDVIQHLEQALSMRVPDARHRLLMHLYLTRAHSRLGQTDAALAALEDLRKLKTGLKDWQMLLESDQAETLRAVLGDDMQTARELVDGTRDVPSLAGTK